MPKKFLLFLVGVSLIATGCNTVNKKLYVEVKEREDQDLYGNAGFLSGNPPEGYQTGFKKTRKVYVMEMVKKPEEEKETPAPTPAVKEEKVEVTPAARFEPVPSETEKELARKIAALEAEEAASASEPKLSEQKMTLTADERREILKIDQPEPKSPIITSDEEKFISEKEGAPTSESMVDLPTEYTVQGNDTLQTISKKFYNSFRKWNVIYEANKDKLPDPNKIKKGMILIIPELQ